MNWFIKILKKPYPFYIPFSRSIRLLIFFSIIVPLFLIVFQPFGIGKSNCEWLTGVLAGLSVPIFLILAINFYGVVRLFPQFFNEHHWNIGREVVWSLWNFFTIVFATSFYWTVVPVCSSSSSIEWAEQLFRAFLIGLIPGITCIYLNYSRALKKKLKKAENLNSILKAKVSYYEHGQLNLVGENNLERISLTTDSLLMIQSQDNYSKVIFETSGKRDNKLIRSSLKHLVDQINYPFIARCHRSFIINLAKIEEVSGNARDFKVKLNNHPDWIPISREAYKRISSLLVEYPPKNDSAISFSSDRSSIPQ